MGKQEVDRTMLTLNKVSVCVGLLGLLVAIILGILQLVGSKQSRQQPPTVKTITVHTQDKVGGEPAKAPLPVQKASSGSPVTQSAKAAPKVAEPVQEVQLKEATGSSTTTPIRRLHPKSKKPNARIIPNSTSTVPPKESDSSK